MEKAGGRNGRKKRENEIQMSDIKERRKRGRERRLDSRRGGKEKRRRKEGRKGGRERDKEEKRVQERQSEGRSIFLKNIPQTRCELEKGIGEAERKRDIG